METYFNATSGKYGLVELKERYKDIRLPHIELVDIKELAHPLLMRQFLDLVRENMALREKVEAGIKAANKTL